MRVTAERAGISRTTLRRVEHGEPGVGGGIYDSVLEALGLLGDREVAADPLREGVRQGRPDDEMPLRASLPCEGSR